MQKQSLCQDSPSTVDSSGSLLTVAVLERPEPDIIVDNSLLQFQPLRWDPIIYPTEHFAYMQPTCWSCSCLWKEQFLKHYTIHIEPPTLLHYIMQTLIYGELASSGTAEQSAVLGVLLKAKIPCPWDSSGHSVADSTRKSWVGGQQPFSRSCQETCMSSGPSLAAIAITQPALQCLRPSAPGPRKSLSL